MRCDKNSDIAAERDYEYNLVRIHKETGAVSQIGFTTAILYKMDVADSEWKDVK